MDSRKSLQTFYGFIFIKKVDGNICGRFPVTKKECIIGRDKNCDIKILLENVSAQHCLIIYVNDKAYIRDTSVAGSTLVNGKKIGRKNFALNHSDEINICGRKFIWEYAKSYINVNNLSKKNNSMGNYKILPNTLKHTPNQINTPLVPKDTNKTYDSPKSILKKPITSNRTPIVVPTTNMSESSFHELKNSFQEQNSTSIFSQSKHKLSESLSVVQGRNIPVFSDPQIITRKSWSIAPDNSSSSGLHILNRLSCERVKRDSTPEYKDNTSYHYADENIEFDSPEPPNTMLNDKYSESIIDLTNGCSVTDNNQNDDNQFTNHINYILPNCEPSTSRRDTYSIDNDVPIKADQNTTPRIHSILKSSKSTKPNKSRSSRQMVQFARLPKTDTKSKSSINYFSKTSNFIVTDDESDEFNNHSNNFKNTMNFNVEDDDLDGVQPLDSSVSSLMNSPILDSSINKSSKRGSRGNKVMSLISSFEKCSNITPKKSLRASDLLSTGGSKYSNASSQRNKNVSPDSISSNRRINLEDVFLAEDSLKDSCNINREETIVQDIDEEPMYNSKVNLSRNADTQQLSNNTSFEEERSFNITLPQNLFELSSNKLLATDSNDKTFTDTEKDNNVTKITINSSETSNKSFISNKIDDKVLEKTTNISENANESIDTEEDNLREQNNSELLKKSTDVKRKHLDVQNVEELVKKSIGVRKSNLNVQNSVTVYSVTEEKDDFDAQNNSSIVEKSGVKKNHLDIQNASRLVKTPTKNEESSIGESPSMIVQCMSECLNTYVNDEIETSLSNESLIKSYVIVEKDDILNQSNKNTIKVQSNNILSDNTNKSDFNEEKSISSNSESRLDHKDTPSSSLVAEVTKNSTNKLADIDNSLRKNNTGSASNSAKKISSNLISSNVSELSTRVLENEDSAVKSNCTNNSNSKLNFLCNNKSTLHSEIMNLNNLFHSENENCSQIFRKKKISNLDGSQLAPISPKEFKDLNKSTKVTENATIGLQNTETRTLKKVIKVIPLSSDTDETLKDTESTTLNLTFGKPKFESTPWNGSKSSKSIQLNEETNKTKNFSDNTNLNWSQMMNDLNESVKKAFISPHIDNIVLIQQPDFCKTDVQTKNSLSSNRTATKRKSEVLCSPDHTETTSDLLTIVKRLPKRNMNTSQITETTTDKINSNVTKISTRSESIRKPQANKKITNKKSLVESSESENDGNDKTKLLSVSNKKEKSKISVTSPSDALNISCDSRNNSNSSNSSFKSSNVSSDNKRIMRIKKKISSSALPPTRRNLRTRTKKNESKNAIEKQEKVNRSASETTSTDTDKKICLEIVNILPTSRKSEANRKEQNISNKKTKPASKGTNSMKPKKNISNIETNADEIKETKKSPIKTCLTRSHVTLTESRQTRLNKNNKTSSPVKSKSSKVVKTTETKSSKSTKRSQSKRVLPSQPVSKFTSVSSECSTSESAEEMVKPDLPKTNKKKTNKKVVQSSTKCNVQENNRDTANVSTQLSTRSRKRTADSSPLTEPNAKSTKNDISSKVASTTLSGSSNSSTKCPRKVSKLAIFHDSDDSIPENLVDSKTGKLSKSSEKTRAKKRALNAENESVNSSGPSTRKMTRKVTTKEKTEIKKSTRATSKSQVQNTDTNKPNSKVKFDEKVEKCIVSDPIKTKSSTRAASQLKKSNISPRVLRTRK